MASWKAALKLRQFPVTCTYSMNEQIDRILANHGNRVMCRLPSRLQRCGGSYKRRRFICKRQTNPKFVLEPVGGEMAKISFYIE